MMQMRSATLEPWPKVMMGNGVVKDHPSQAFENDKELINFQD
jgi:hypothetical protein